MSLSTKNTKLGPGTFTNIPIPKNSFIIEFKGNIFNKDSLKHKKSQVLQIGTNTYLGPSGTFDDYINHSCNPNSYLHVVGKRAFLYSIHEIKPNQEITFDYSTTSLDSKEEWTMICHCNSYNCRKEISGFQYLSTQLKEFYIKNDIVPYFMKDNLTKITT